jgi:hypothetical protein
MLADNLLQINFKELWFVCSMLEACHKFGMLNAQITVIAMLPMNFWYFT